MSIDNEKFISILKQKKLRLTGARLSLYSFLAESKRPLSINSLVNSLSSKADRASVYRNIELFEKIGVINKVYTGWKYRLELSEKFRPHHHHFTCENCDEVTTIDLGNNIEKSLDDIGNKHGFKITDHQFELHGLCKKCL